MKASLKQVKALAFDVFGTVVDWRGSIVSEGSRLGRRNEVTPEKRFDLDAEGFGELASKPGCR